MTIFKPAQKNLPRHSVGNAVVLDRTAFYPGGGGQPADTGTLPPAAGGDSSAVTTAAPVPPAPTTPCGCAPSTPE